MCITRNKKIRTDLHKILLYFNQLNRSNCDTGIECGNFIEKTIIPQYRFFI